LDALKPFFPVIALLAAIEAAADPCPTIAGIEPLLRPGVALLVGEIHGTKEGPAAVANVACVAVEEDLKVTVGLEIPQSENNRVQRYLESDGKLTDEVELLAGDFWQRDDQDGRSSRAMLRLIEALRKLRARSGRLEVVVLDNPIAPQGRDLFMAQWLKLVIADAPGRLLVTLTGNLHSRLTPFDDERAPMGYLLARSSPELDVISLQITHAGGTAWVCTPGDGCGVARLRGDATPNSGIELFDETTEDGYSGRYHVGRIAASPPAKQR
jgi:hypothetical protein